MTQLLRKPVGPSGFIHEITPETAGWRYVGFTVFRGVEGDHFDRHFPTEECILVMVEGLAEVSVEGTSHGEVGDRLDVFERTPPHCVYAPADSRISVTLTTQATVALCLAPGKGAHRSRRLGPEGISLDVRGEGTNTRYIHNIAMEGRDVADSLLVTEVFTPPGHWSSYPPHRHDEDDFPRITYLEETYYHRLSPAQGFGIQRVFTDDGSLDETLSVSNHDVVLVPRGYHPCAAPHGYDMYYLNVMAGPLRKWRFENHPDHAWIVEGA
ncbi:5-deoxy-glucuronate isomerase [Ovoidimarina sediminis]|uniref:5-deoxy-glucuronate isomerase n=1 Tax=Ovoidimarina sediminis TaxID=3079856 RepID=UPI00290C838C|nr:5-deoxy-glucuronate isomerase [Rhodophyticola sp. MJ-SS7]MDU8945228.1 5-deoxy-glucuronate isomerase [Rhodophyticola sp. MJ-SS7]